MAASRSNENAERGRLGEHHAAASFGLEHVADDPETPPHVDAVARDDVVQAGVVVLEAGTPVDAKVARVSLEGGERAGRIKLRRPNHERLLEDEGAYAIVVVDEDHHVLASTLVRAETVDLHVDEWWSPGHSRRDRGAFVQLPWTAFFDVTPSELATMTESLEGDNE